jgi:AcrR family transcriptional regulator
MGKKGEATKEAILQAALELFVRKGYHGTSINEITHKAGVTKGALYSYFTGKGELLLQIIEQYKVRSLNEMIKTVSEYPGNALEKLHRTISFNSKFAYENKDLVVFLTFLSTELNADVDFEPALESVYREYQKFISQLIRQGIRQGLFRKELDPELAALVFIGLHDGVLHQWVLNRNYIDSGKYVSTFRRIFLNGLAS